MATTDKAEWRLLDVDLTTQLAILPAVQSHILYEMNEPGSGEVRLPLDTPAASQITENMFCALYYRGSARGGFFVEALKETKIDTAEYSGRVLSAAGAGALALLADGIVWSDGTTETKRAFTATPKAEILITLLEEAQARGALPNLTWDFTDAADSDSVAWDDSEDYEITVGDNLLNVARDFSSTGGFDFAINLVAGEFVLSAFKNGMGTDVSDTILFRSGTNVQELGADRRGNEIANALLVKHGEGYSEIKDNTSIAAYRRREQFLNADLAQSAASAATYAGAKLEESKDPQTSISIKAYDGIKPYVFLDYVLGDTISYDVLGTLSSHRILGLQLDFEGDDYAAAILELNNLFYENDLERSRDIEWLLTQWNTAHDSNLLEARGWMAYNNTYNNLTAINAIHQLGDYLYIGGQVSSAGYSGRLLRYNLLTGEWTTLVAIIGLVKCITSIGTDIYFGTINAGTTQGCLHRYNTLTGGETEPIQINAPDGSFDISRCNALLAVGTDLYATGEFNQADGNFDVKNIIKVDTTDFSYISMDGGLDNGIGFALAELGGNIYLGYSGTSVGGVSASRVAMWDGTNWNALDTGLNGTVYALTVYGSNILAGGAFTNGLSEWNGAAWTTFGGGTAGTVYAIDIFLTDVYVGGDFTDIGNNVALYSGGLWNSLDSGVNNDVYTVLHYSQNLYVGGLLTVAGGDVGAQRTALYYVTFQALADQLARNFNSYDLGEGIHTATAVTSLASGDEFPMWNAATGLLRKITWANILAALNNLFVRLTTDQTVAGVKRFSDSIQIGVDPPTAEADGGMSQGSEGASVGNLLWTWGTGVSSFITGLRARGTKASPTAAQANDDGLRLGARFHDDSTYGNTSARIKLAAAENHSSTAHGTKILLETTPLGSTTINPTPPFVTPDGDIEFPVDTTGVILKDRTTGNLYRLYVDSGALLIETV